MQVLDHGRRTLVLVVLVVAPVLVSGCVDAPSTQPPDVTVGVTSSTSTSSTTPVAGDADGDGFAAPADCDDLDEFVHPGASDPFDDNAVDADCDGADGTLSRQIRVSSATGADTAGCGLPGAQPCKDIWKGQQRAQETSRSVVMVAGGTYSQFVLAPGMTIQGGFGQTFYYGHGQPDTTAVVVGAPSSSADQPSYAILAENITVARRPSRLSELTVVGPDTSASHSPTYALIVRSSTSALSLDHIHAVGGQAASGSKGANGTWAGSRYEYGAQGQNSEELDSILANTGRQAGGGINNPFFLGGMNSNAGAGGDGGQTDTSSTNFDATAGLRGGDAAIVGVGCGHGGAGGAPSSSGVGGSGTPGETGCEFPGVGGAGGIASLGAIAGGAWVPVGGNGANGTLGAQGGAGGGGGGGGGSDDGIDDRGAGGGAGGPGGLASSQAATGGTTGMASVAVLLVDSTAKLTALDITLGQGGNGGAGGESGLGGDYGFAGFGGAGECGTYDMEWLDQYGWCTNKTGQGGKGAIGGHGGRGGSSGAGGGGAGGPSIGLLMHNTADTTVSGATFSGGTGGVGGLAGPGPEGATVSPVVLGHQGANGLRSSWLVL